MGFEQCSGSPKVGMFEAGLVEGRAHLARTDSNGIRCAFQRLENPVLTPKPKRPGLENGLPYDLA